ncbi:hypothetical protein BDZ94DRAFT_1215558 [Collybia nuda]|uniref:Uncharacterized protein n=1 Tax=Collybia nuda TaxID=64659 RepID=A0A9P6CG36_9AGAR|nr:hypothetical protein BDZ94DRAFT_1215558 [Collybia nuda]
MVRYPSRLPPLPLSLTFTHNSLNLCVLSLPSSAMPSAVAENGGQHYACKCLNIRIRPQLTEAVATDLIADADFTPVFVGGEGIIVAHPQVTVRTRTRGTPINGSTRCFRYTTITCLICGLLAYRVYQTYPADVEGKDGPLLPTEDWVERDILKSSNGWVEVHKQCLTGNDLQDAESSMNYSRTFSLLLPLMQSLPPPIEPIFERPPSPRSTPEPSPPPPVTYLSNLRPLFLPPPYTPSHPIFTYLASLANEESLIRRAAAEQSIVDLIQVKVTEIEKADTELRRNVEILWQKFRERVGQIQQDRATMPKAPPLKSSERPSTNGLGSPTSGTPVTIRNFTPSIISPSRSPPPRAPPMSGISASLATSSFHGPRGRSQTSSPVPDRPWSSGSNRSSASSNSGSSTLVLPLPSDGSNILKYRRVVNETINTAASFQYFVNLEEDMARHKRNTEKEENSESQETVWNQRSGPSRKAGSPDVKDDGKRTPPKGESSTTHIQSQESERSSSRGRETTPKGKKKVVTFDVQPEVVTIRRDANSEKEEDDPLASQDQREEVFVIDLDEEGSENSPSLKPTLPLVEQPAQPQRPKKSRSQNTGGLSGSFSGLRPSSLPAPSHVRPPRGQHGSDVSTSLSLARPFPRPRIPASSSVDPPALTEAQDEAILKLVAADTPSHRGAWKPDSKAWQTFVRRKDSKGHTGGEDIPEEDATDVLDFGVSEMARPIKSWSYYDGPNDEGDDFTAMGADFVGSLPIPIKSVHRSLPTLSLASYQPDTAVSERPLNLPPTVQKGSSSAAIRKAAYAERDRSRSMDPGALDFAAEEDEPDEEDEDSQLPEDLSKPDAMGAGDRGRKRALKILQARSEVPEAGMWRSLAS